MNSSDYKIMTFNVRGLRETSKRRSIFRHIHTKYPDTIAVLQETHSSEEVESIWKNEFGSDIIFAHGKSLYQGGIAICLPKALCAAAKKCIAARMVEYW